MNTRRLDLPLFGIIAALTVIGLLMVGSAGSVIGSAQDGPFHLLISQLWKLLPGLVLLVLFWVVPYQKLSKLTRLALPASLLLLVLVLVQGVGTSSHAAQRWISLGFFSFQPAELVKLFLVLYLADNLTRRKDQLSEFKTGLLPPLIMILLACGLLLLQPDLSSAVLVFVTAFTMFLIGGVSGKQLLLTLLVLVPLTLLAIYAEPYRWARITAFVDPWAVSDGEGYQVVQSLLAIGSGGLTGVGLGASTQKLFYLPEAHTDFIFSILVEEMGLLGSLMVVVLFAGLIIIGLRIAKNCSDAFGRLLAVGITAWLGVQVIFNLGVVTALLPTTGLPLPFISYGGTSLVISLAAVGILGNIARQTASGAIAPVVVKQTSTSSMATATPFTRTVRSPSTGSRVYNPSRDHRRRWS